MNDDDHRSNTEGWKKIKRFDEWRGRFIYAAYSLNRAVKMRFLEQNPFHNPTIILDQFI